MLLLEPRHCLAVQVWYGGEVWVGTHSEQPFADWSGDLQTVDSGHLRYVAGRDGAGPRVAVYDLRTGERDRPDWFADDPASRRGVAFVAPDTPPPVYVPGVEPMTAGDTHDFTVYVDFEDHRGTAWERDVFAAASDDLVPLGLHLTTTRPNAPAGQYLTVVVPADLAFQGAGVAGLTPSTSLWNTILDPWQPRTVFAGIVVASAPLTGKVIAHETGHFFGLDHVSDPGDIMAPSLSLNAHWSDSELAVLTDRIHFLRGTP